MRAAAFGLVLMRRMGWPCWSVPAMLRFVPSGAVNQALRLPSFRSIRRTWEGVSTTLPPPAGIDTRIAGRAGAGLEGRHDGFVGVRRWWRRIGTHPVCGAGAGGVHDPDLGRDGRTLA